MRDPFVIVAVVAFLISGQASLAQSSGCSGIVVPGERSMAPVRLMAVGASGGRVHFVEEAGAGRQGCPSPSPQCQRKAFVVPGDRVLVGVPAGDYVCASYISPDARRLKGQFAETHGLLPLKALLPVRPTEDDAWIGIWQRSSEAEIKISRAALGRLAVKGEATFGALDAGRRARGAVNSGELEGEALPVGGGLAIGWQYVDPIAPFPEGAPDCRARLRLFGYYLVVEDNMQCGGANVTFTGIYVRRK
ncbi:MAG: hypothetical protein LDL22_07155 [Hyphomicrobiales bacterium]|nr:hypothetical protein [Hyphomicrobiales bacterium]